MIEQVQSIEGQQSTRPKRPVATGDWSKDCQLGREYAKQIVSYMSNTGNPGALFFATEEIRDHEGLRVGFCNAVAVLLLANT